MTISFPKPDIEQFLRTYYTTHFTVNKNESKLVFSSNLNGKFNLWAMDLPSTYPYALTFNNQSSEFAEFDPNGQFILTGFDNDGDENYQIYAIPTEGGTPFPILTGEKHEKYYFGYLSKDGNRIYYMTSKDNPQFLDIRLYHLDSGKDELLIKGENGTTYFAGISPTEKAFAFTKIFANTYSLGYVKIGDEIICITPDEHIVHTVSNITFVDDTTILFVTNYDDDFSYLASFDLETKTFLPLHKFVEEDIFDVQYHKETKTAYVVTMKGVVDFLYTVSLESGAIEKVAYPLETVQQLTVAESGNLYLLGRSAVTSFNIYRKEVGKEWEALTKNNVPGVSEEGLVDPEIVRYSSFDGLQIEALLFRANPEVANGYTVFWPHGGPQAAERKSFRGAFQFLLAQGYNLFAPNFRGSTGYGANFTKLVEGDWGEGPRLDNVAGIEWLFENGITDRDKLFLFGGSYGGYMALLLAGRHPEYFRACVDIFGPSNLFTFIDSVPDHWKPLMERWLGDPLKDKERLIKDSPITYLNSMTKPMLIIQGANDPRVVKAESDQIVAALKEQGTEVDYLVFDDEGHGFSKKENEIKAYRLVLDFLNKHTEEDHTVAAKEGNTEA